MHLMRVTDNRALTKQTTVTVLGSSLVIALVSLICWQVFAPAEAGRKLDVDLSVQNKINLGSQFSAHSDFHGPRSETSEVGAELPFLPSAHIEPTISHKRDVRLGRGMETLHKFHAALRTGDVNQIDRVWNSVLRCQACLVQLSDHIAYGSFDPLWQSEIAIRFVRDNVPQGIHAVISALDVSIAEENLTGIDNLMSALEGLEGIGGAQALIDAVAKGTAYMSADTMSDDLLHVVAKTLAHVPDSSDVGELIASEMSSADFETRDRLEVLAKQNAEAIVQLSATDEHFTVLLDEFMNNASAASALGSLAAKAQNVTLVGALDSAISNNDFTQDELIEFSVEVGLGIKDQETVDAFVVYLNETQSTQDENLKSQMTAIALTQSDLPEAEAAVERYLEVAQVEHPGDAELVQSLRD